MNRIAGVVCLLIGALGGGAALAQPFAAPPENVLQLSTSASVETPQDLLIMTLSATRDGPDAAAVQNPLKVLLDAALSEARRAVLPGQLEVRSGNFTVQPRHGRDGRIQGWQGTAELVLEGRDFARIGQVAARLQGMAVTGLGFALSRQQRERVESEAQQQAIARFREKAQELAKAFGFAGYGLRDVSVQSNEQGPGIRPRMLAMEARTASADMPVPVEAGKASVMVTVSGAVQLR
jgi:predicted secreted protein